MTFRIALVGNPNVGKSSFFNSVSGERQKVANWPGKTIERRSALIMLDGKEVELTDLPGAYSLAPLSEDERVVLDAISSEEKFDAIIHIVDASNLERNLYLTTDLLSRGENVVCAINFLGPSGEREIDEKALGKGFGIPFAKVDARKRESALQAMRLALESNGAFRKKSALFKKSDSPKKRYLAISAILKGAVQSMAAEPKSPFDFDSLALNPIIGPLIFLATMFGIFHLTFLLSEPINSLFDLMFGAQAELAVELVKGVQFLPEWFSSLLESGVLAGVGAVISFLPQIATMSFLLYFLEDSGYLARVAAVLDSLLRRFGLGGKAIIPMLLGFGCNVPAMMGTRIIREERVKKIAILSIPFMSCSARLPVYVLFSGIFFPGHEAVAIFCLYFLGFAVALLSAYFMKPLFSRGEGAEEGRDILLIELPKYRFPYPKNLVVDTGESLRSFAERAGTIILGASVVMWFLASAPYGVEYGSKESLAGLLGGIFSPIFAPLGFDSWHASLAILNGMVAKEVVISSFATTYGTGEGEEISRRISDDFSPDAAVAFMIFVLLYIPCFAALGAIRSETGSWKTAFLASIYYVAVAYVFAIFGRFSFLLFFGGIPA